MVVEIAAEPDAQKEPIWCERKTTPPSRPRCRVPNMMATRPLVGGTVDSHRSPIRTAKSTTVVGEAGTNRKPDTTIERAI